VAAEALYLDSSALVKLVAPEAESDALAEVVGSAPVAVSSIVAAVEVRRAVRRVSDDSLALQRADHLLAATDLLVLTEEVILAATRAVPEAVRSLDAIHLGSALTIKDELRGFVAYDRRLQAAAEKLGLSVLAPNAG
jgi:predicted nucleic acid-binding protein